MADKKGPIRGREWKRKIKEKITTEKNRFRGRVGYRGEGVLMLRGRSAAQVRGSLGLF